MTYQAKIIAGGKIVIPAELRRELGLQIGDTLVIEREGNALVLKSYLQVVREVQREFQAMMKESDTVDAFIADRRAEAEHE